LRGISDLVSIHPEQGICEVGGIIREYINVFNGKEKTQSLYWRTLDPVTLTPSKDKTKVDSRSGKDYKSGGFQVLSAYSPDRSKLLIVTRAPENRGDGYLFEVYDQNFNLIWDMIPKLSLDDHELSLNLTVAYKSDLVNLQVDNDGFAYCLGGYYETVGDHREEVFFGVKLDVKSISYSHLLVEKADIRTPYLSLSKAGEPIVAGFYDAEPADKEDRQNGFFFGLLDFEEGKAPISLSKFPDEFIKNWWAVEEIKDYDRELAKGKPTGFSSLILKDIALNNEGGLTLVAQNSSAHRTIGNIVLIDIDSK